jgi:2-(1,2-epoxy-1,2-dihydrophenyl)acetyl-CoA isomerase
MPGSESLLTDLKNGVLTLTLNRPKVNALSLELMENLRSAFKQAERDEQVRCVVLTGAGGNFSAGQDIHVFQQNVDIPFRYHMLRTYNPLVLQIRGLEKPVLAAVDGICSGAALGLALACDLRIASDKVHFVVGFTGIGLVPDSAVSLLLPAIIGLGRALEFTFSNVPISADQALAWGMVNRVTPAVELAEQSALLAAALAQGPTRTMGLAKRAFNKAVLGNLEQTLDYEAHLQEVAGHTPEHKEGVQAFLEKRLPDFSGKNL